MSRMSRDRKSRRQEARQRATASASQSPGFVMSAIAAVKKAPPRSDVHPAMLRVWGGGWEFDESHCRDVGCESEGYYPASALLKVLQPEDAMDLFVHHNYKGNRPFDEDHALAIAEGMTVAHVDIAIGPDGYPQVVNGQHTLWAVYLRGRATQADIVIYQCRNPEAMAAAYATFDIGKNRTQTNIIDAYKSAGRIVTEINSAKLARCSQWAGLAENGYNRHAKESKTTKHARSLRADVLEFTEWVFGLVCNGDRERLAKGGIGAALWSMWVSDRQKAQEFAQGYFSGENLAEGSPMLLLRNRIVGVPKGMHGGSVSLEMTQWAYSAWKKFCLGESMYLLKATKDLPPPTQWRVNPSSLARRSLGTESVPPTVATHPIHRHEVGVS